MKFHKDFLTSEINSITSDGLGQKTDICNSDLQAGSTFACLSCKKECMRQSNHCAI